MDVNELAELYRSSIVDADPSFRRHYDQQTGSGKTLGDVLLEILEGEGSEVFERTVIEHSVSVQEPVMNSILKNQAERFGLPFSNSSDGRRDTFLETDVKTYLEAERSGIDCNYINGQFEEIKTYMVEHMGRMTPGGPYRPGKIMRFVIDGLKALNFDTLNENAYEQTGNLIGGGSRQGLADQWPEQFNREMKARFGRQATTTDEQLEMLRNAPVIRDLKDQYTADGKPAYGRGFFDVVSLKPISAQK